MDEVRKPINSLRLICVHEVLCLNVSRSTYCFVLEPGIYLIQNNPSELSNLASGASYLDIFRCFFQSV
jgi:hypothetical protein